MNPHRCSPKISLISVAALAVGLFGLSQALTAQTVAPTPAGGEATLLEAFVVESSQDVGYATTNAIGVTRTNTALIDIPQVVNVLTRQFLEDTAAGELYDALKYVSGISIESNVGDSVMIRGYTVRSNHTDGLVDNQNQSQAGAEPRVFCDRTGSG